MELILTRLEKRLEELLTTRDQAMLQMQMISGAVAECQNTIALVKKEIDDGRRHQELDAGRNVEPVSEVGRLLDDAAEGECQ